MSKKVTDSIKVACIAILLLVVSGWNGWLPWWGFVIPVFFLGLILQIRNWQAPAFLIGFLSGFIVWSGMNLYLDLTLGGNVLGKLALLVSAPKIVLLLVAGVLGGLLTGLALFAGSSVLKRNKATA